MIKEYFEQIIQDLSVSHAIKSFKVLAMEVGEEDGYVHAELNYPTALDFTRITKLAFVISN